jgi:U3 small nucleolar RNA-associated protein 10
MSSSLAAQLRVLSGAGRESSTRFVASHPSFLFDARAAADTDSETIYDIGLSGLAELKAVDDRFAGFEETLFKSVPGGARALDRKAQTAGQNEQLDASVALLFRVLSPYFVQTAAHKVIEYLVRRYAVQEHNVDSILECILPYHESPLFARFLQLLNLGSTPRWEFLRTAQKNNSVLSRATLIQRCISVRTNWFASRV